MTHIMAESPPNIMDTYLGMCSPAGLSAVVEMFQHDVEQKKQENKWFHFYEVKHIKKN